MSAESRGFTILLQSIAKKADDLFGVELPDGTEVVFRLPSCKQAEQYAKVLGLCENISEQAVVYDQIFRTYVEDKFLTDLDIDLPAGIPETISRVILYLSGLDNKSVEYTEQLFQQNRADHNKPINSMKTFVCGVFAGYTLEYLDTLSYQQIVRAFIAAEQHLINTGIIEKEHSFESPEDQKTKEAQTIQQTIKDDVRAYKAFSSVNPTREELTQARAQRAAQREAELRRRGFIKD